MTLLFAKVINEQVGFLQLCFESLDLLPFLTVGWSIKGPTVDNLLVFNLETIVFDF